MATKTATATLSVTGPPDQIRTFLRFCLVIDRLCRWGSSRTLVLAVDGDGAGSLRFDIGELDMAGIELPALEKDPLHLGGIGDN